MEAVIKENKAIERPTIMKLTERELFLIEWSLDMMARNPSHTGTSRQEIDKLRLKFAMRQSN